MPTGIAIYERSEKYSGSIAFLAIFTAVFLSCLLIGQRMMNADGDLGRHLVVGAYILQNHEIPLIDHFSHTLAGAAFTPHEWLAEVLFTLAYRLGKFSGVVWLTAFDLSVAYACYSWLIYKINRRIWSTLFLVTTAIAAGSLHFLTRPHIFSILFFSLLLLLLQSRVKPILAGSLIFILFVLWANTHGGFLYGIWYLIIILTAESIHAFVWKNKLIFKSSLFYLLAAFSGTMINPAGWKLYQTAFGFLSSSYLVRHTVEYLPPDFGDPFGRLYFLIVLAVTVVFFIKKKSLKLVDIIIGTVWAGLGFISARHIPFAVLVLLEAPARLLGSTTNSDEELSRRYSLHGFPYRLSVKPSVFIIGVFLCAITGCGFLLAEKLEYSFSEEAFPVKAVEVIRSEPPGGNMFNEFTWGGYLLFREIPNGKVFIDGQTDFYGEKLARDYISIRQAQAGWELLLQKYDVKWVILPPDAPLVKILRVLPSTWQVLFEDSIAVILTHP